MTFALATSTTSSPFSPLYALANHAAAALRLLKISTESIGLCPPMKPMWSTNGSVGASSS